MAGTREGNLKGAATKRQKYGTDHFSKIGAAGGAKSKGRQIPPEVRQKISNSKKFRNAIRRSRDGEAGLPDNNPSPDGE